MIGSLPSTSVAALNAVPRTELAELLGACCGSARWVDSMIARRPFPSLDAVLAASDDICRSLSHEDWLEAFSHHPPRAAGSPRDPAAETDAAVLTALAAANVAYTKRFGYGCIICAIGQDPEQILAITRARLRNSPEVELRSSADEQRNLTRLRLRARLHDAPGLQPV